MSNIVTLPEEETATDVTMQDRLTQPGPLVIEENEQRRAWEDPNRYRDRNEESMIRFEAEEGGFTGAISREFLHGGNIAYNLYRDYHRKSENGPTDPAWTNDKKNEFIAENVKEIGAEQAWRFWGTKNEAEARELFADMQGDKRAMRVQNELGTATGLAAGFMAGMFDVDAPLMLLSGGLAPAAKLGITATRAGRAALGMAAGAATGVGMGALDYQVNPNSEQEDIALYGVMGAGFGLFGGALSGAPSRDLTAGISKGVQEEIGEDLSAGYRREVHAAGSDNPWEVPSPEPVAPAPDKPAGEGSSETAGMDPDDAIASPEPTSRQPGVFSIKPEGEASVGAAQVAGAGIRRDGTGLVNSAEQQTIIKNAQARDKQLGVTQEWQDSAVNENNAVTAAAGRKAGRFSQAVQKLGLGTDFGKMMNSNSSVLRMLAYDVLESASGIGRNAASASIYRENYRNNMAAVFQPYYDGLKQWKAENGYTWRDDYWPVRNGPSAQEQFDKEVIVELMSRMYGGQGSKNKHVKQAADAHDAMYALDIEIGQGRGGEIGMDAYQGLKKRAGYVSQQWDGASMKRMIDDAERAKAGGGNKMRDKIVRAIDEEYKKQYSTMKPEERWIIAGAVVDRALTNNRSISRNLLTLLNGDEAPFVRSRLAQNGLKEDQIDRIMNGLIGSREEKGKPGHTQARYDVDFRSVSSNGISMMDLLSVNLHEMAHRRIARTSGLAALARKGITSREKFEQIKAAGLAEQEATGRKVFEQDRDLRTKARDMLEDDKPVDAEFLDDIYSYFNGTPIAGGVSPTYARIKKLTSLALMNQLGLTQTAEFGAVAAGVGLDNFFRHAGVMFTKAASDKASPLMQEMHHFGIFIPEENAFRPDLAFEHEKMANDGVLGDKLDRMLNKGTRLQGYVSGFYAVRGAQQKMVLSAGTARLFESIKRGGKGQWNDMRIADMGVDLDLYEDLINKGIPEFDAEGRLVKMNFDQWPHETQQNYRNSMHRLTGQLVQKAMAGESNVMFHKDGMAQLFWQFKSFPLLSVEKQFHRNMRFADSGTLQLMMFGTISAGLAYSSRQLVNGRTDRLDVDSIARGALNYSNFAGWIPMWVDPVAAMLGLENYNTSGYSSRSGGNIVSVPAAFGVLDKFGMIPSSAAAVVGSPTGLIDYDNNNIRALQTIPIIGNMYGMNFLLNSLRKEGRPRKEEQTEAAPSPTDNQAMVNDALGIQ